ncbi:MAG: Re/Si-specific NAD(P)(+) transhydrogenase subunit alpha [Pseudomonadota bacterium]
MVTVATTTEPVGEPRVAISPDTAKRLSGLGCTVKIQTGAGLRSHFSDTAYREAGADVVDTADAAASGANLLLQVTRPPPELTSQLAADGGVVAMLEPYATGPELDGLVGAGRLLFSMEFMPRTTRAQAMDVLSSQANLAGYKAVVDASSLFEQALPMMMTAAGTVPAARVFVMGAGVAGLQAIATARRLGAIVTATDVRPATKEQVASLGAKFIAVENEEFLAAQTAAGYAKPMSEDYQRQQAELVANHVKSQDIVVTTAQIPGRQAPRLISREMVESMKPGSVIVDLAATTGGNCELTQAGETVDHNGVRIVGPKNLPGTVSVNASTLYAKNLLTFIQLMIEQDADALKIDWEDDIIQGTLIARDGQIVHANLLPKQENGNA